MEELIDQVDKFKELIDYISLKTDNNEKETCAIIKKLDIDNPHFTRHISTEKYKRLIDKLILFRKIIKGK